MISSARAHRLSARVGGLALLALLTAASCASGGATASAEATASATPESTPGSKCVITDQRITDSAGDGSWERKQYYPVFSKCPGAAALNAAVAVKRNQVMAQFAASLTDLPAEARPASLDVSYSIALSTPEVLSIRFKSIEDFRGPHAGTTYSGLTLRVADGSEIALEDLFTDTTAALNELSTRSRAAVTAQLGADGDPGSINDGTTPVLANFNSAWVLTEAGLEITFQEYQVGPYVIGAPVVVIPWSDLASVIAPAGPAAGLLP